MKKYILIMFPFVLFSCAALMGKFNRSAYQKADRIIYEELFENKRTEIANKEIVLDIVELLSKSTKVSEDFIPKDQLLFVRVKDTLVLYKNGTYIKDSRGTYSLTNSEEERLMELLKKK